MQLKQQLLEWYNTQLEDKNIFIAALDELASGYIFLEVLHNFHPSVVDLAKVYIKPKNSYQVLQNFKHLVSCFSKIGWKRFDPERYSKRKEKDYLSLAQTLKKIFSVRSIKESRLQSHLDITHEEFKCQDDVKSVKPESFIIHSSIAKLEKTKKELLSKISRIQEQLWVEVPGEDANKIDDLKQRIAVILGSCELN